MPTPFREQLVDLLEAHSVWIRAQERHDRLWDARLATQEVGVDALAANFKKMLEAEDRFRCQLRQLFDAYPDLAGHRCACSVCECENTPDDDGICSACKVGLHSRNRRKE